MATSTTIVNACGVVIKIDNSGGTPTDVSGSANEAKLATSRALGDWTVFGDSNTYRLECKRDASLDLKILYSKAADESLDLLEDWDDVGGARTITIDVPSSAAASSGRRYTGEFRLESLEVPLKADDPKPIMVSASLKIDGALTRSIIP